MAARWMVLATLQFLAGVAMAVWGVQTTIGCPGAPVQMPYRGPAMIDCISGEPAAIDHRYAERGTWIAVGVASAAAVLWAGRRRSRLRSALVAAAGIVLVGAVVWALLLVPSEPRGHGDTRTGSFPIYENNTELRIVIAVGGILVAAALLWWATRSRERSNSN